MASWKFFAHRINYEEFTLLNHFPNEYPQYKASTTIGIPGIRGFSVEDADIDDEDKDE